MWPANTFHMVFRFSFNLRCAPSQRSLYLNPKLNTRTMLTYQHFIRKCWPAGDLAWSNLAFLEKNLNTPAAKHKPRCCLNTPNMSCFSLVRNGFPKAPRPRCDKSAGPLCTKRFTSQVVCTPLTRFSTTKRFWATANPFCDLKKTKCSLQRMCAQTFKNNSWWPLTLRSSRRRCLFNAKHFEWGKPS